MNKPLLLRLVALFLVASAPATVVAAPDADSAGLIRKARVDIEDAQFANSAEKFADVDKLLDAGLQLEPTSGLLLHYRGYLQYRWSSVLKGDEAFEMLRKADDSLVASLKQVEIPESHALRAIVLSRMIPLRPREVMQLSQQSSAAIMKALELAPENPRVWMLKGMMDLFTPEAFGGGAGAALKEFGKAEKFFATDKPAELAPAWGDAELQAWTGIAAARKGDATGAEVAYRKALKRFPEYPWVKYILYPNLMDQKDPFAERAH